MIRKVIKKIKKRRINEKGKGKDERGKKKKKKRNEEKKIKI